MIAAPQPPSLKLPQRVRDLAAQRTGDQVDLRWTMPRRATDNVLLTGKQRVRICRREQGQLCTYVGDLLLAPQAAGSYSDHLPSALASGPPRVLLYTLEIENQHGRSAGPSNTAVTAAGAAPPQITGLRAQAQAQGILLSWTPEGGNETIRIHRVLGRLLGRLPGSANTKLPAEQALEFSGEDQGRVLDTDAALDHTYTYTVWRVARVTLQSRPVQIDSAPSDPVTLDARDIFPPATPTGLEAVADPEAHSIDLSWQPDIEADLAGYTVYRRESGSAAPPVRISPPAEPAPAFRDLHVVPGAAYLYSVSAVDRDGNESSRSAEVQEMLPQQ